ncbi:MAG: ABC transporter permease [Agathobaculum sp.]|uniref:ABC transporter permease n=1 Tax=Agathobaculum sp. TaxID=2048138 RepID=UPI0025C6EDC2|nr:ABC transporter permease [Agathobaculum sp.]MCI7124622.1 ABC transporter permease [Agathobaculum sp.]MDY3712749.1 ABC transporter permease [Agathobaculum sp.]
MNWGQTMRMAFKSVMNNKVRSVLTMLGIIIGVASVIAIVAFVQGASTLQRLQYEAMGTNQIQIYGWGPRSADWKALETYIDTEMKDEIKAWSPQGQYWDWQNKGIKYRSKTLEMNNTQIYFGNQDYGACTNNVITAGRDLSEADCRNAAKVCVIGETVRKAFFGAMSPLGQSIRIGGTSFKVIGVYKGKFGGKLNSQDQMIVLPYTLQQRMMGDPGQNRQYYAQAASKDAIEPAIEKIRKFMSARYDSSNGNFEVYSNAQWQEQAEASSNMLALLGGGIAGISLLVGGIGIMNIMLVSVTERTREIGIRMAIGARKRDIISQFLVEAAVVSCCGGMLGIILGCFAATILGNLLLLQQAQGGGWMPVIENFTVLPSFGLVAGAFLFSALLGIIFGLYPANKASNLQPVDALRTQ